MYKKILVNIFKFSLALGLIYWLVQSGKLDFTLLNEVAKSPFKILLYISLFLGVLGIVAYRWRIILVDRCKKTLPYFLIFKSCWIGLFFNSVLPGSVSGDLIKVFYVKDLDEKLTKKL